MSLWTSLLKLLLLHSIDFGHFCFDFHLYHGIFKISSLIFFSSSIDCLMKWKLLSRVQLFATPWTIQSTVFSRPDYWKWVSFPFSRDIPNPGIEPRSPTLWVDSLPAEPQGKPKNTGMGSLSLLQWIFLTQELNQGLLHCRQILYQLSYQASPVSLVACCLVSTFSFFPGIVVDFQLYNIAGKMLDKQLYIYLFRFLIVKWNILK